MRTVLRALAPIVSLLLVGATPSAAEFRSYGQVEEIRDGQRFFFFPWDVSGGTGAGDGKTFTDSDMMITMSASSLADIGGLRASASAAIRETSVNVPLGSDLSRSGIAVALGTYEVTVTGPSGPVEVSFDMELGGSLIAASANTVVDLNASNSAVNVTFRVDDAAQSSGGFGISSTAGSPNPPIVLGILGDWTPPLGTITSVPFTVQAGTPFTLQIELLVIVSVNADATEDAFVAQSTSDFGSTLRFPTGAPVFHLPAGYSVSSPDAGIVDNQVPCTEDCTKFQSKCDAAKLGCVAKRQACLLKVHATAETKGVTPDAAALEKCADTLAPCLAKLESKQNPAKPKTLCSKTGDLVGLTLANDDFVTDVVSAIDPAFPTVGPPSACDGGKKTCVAKRTACLLKVLAAATKKGVPAAVAAVQACKDKFDGGAKGFAKGCLGKLQAKQNADKPKTLCAVTDDGTALGARIETYVDETLQAVLNLDVE